VYGWGGGEEVGVGMSKTRVLGTNQKEEKGKESTLRSHKEGLIKAGEPI